MARPPRLKVFCTPVGFYDALVAAPSQKAALKAWGTTTDLFSAGRASVVEDPELQELALARPGEVVKRPRGDAHQLIEQMEAEEARERKARPKQAAEKRAVPKAAKPRPDRAELDSTVQDFEVAERELRDGLDAIAESRAALDEQERALRARLEDRLAGLRSRRDRLAAAFRRTAQPKRR
jgi:hypothetical protein